MDKAVVEMSGKIASMSTRKAEKADEIRRLEKQTASIHPAIDGINDILSRFGFSNFFLAKSDSGAFYKLIRSDGSDAKATLSEGEKNFVTFLYFYHLMRGNESESGMTTDRVVVFDDPVSSLDCDILFIVSSLIKGLFDEVRSGDGYIKQVFVLTHNVYFHKEVTFVGRRARNAVMKGETFGSPKVRVGHFASLTLGGGSSMSVPQRHDHPDERGRRVTPKSENSAPSVQAGKSRMCTVSHLSIVI